MSGTSKGPLPPRKPTNILDEKPKMPRNAKPMHRKPVICFSAGVLLLAALPIAHASVPQLEKDYGHQTVSGDFNGDGYDDLAVGNPSGKDTDAYGKIVESGTVDLFYGSASGLSDAPMEVWVQDGTVFPNGRVEKGDQFGHALAAGDLNDDGYDDLAIGAPGEDIAISDEDRKDAGVVNVLYGSPNGLDADSAQTWYQSQKLLPGISEKDDGFGMAMTIGDFDNDGYGDLAIGVPREDVGNLEDMGVLVILRGSANGLTSENVTEWHQNKYGVASIGRAHEMFGYSVVSGDFNADGVDDVAIGVPYDMVSTGNGNPPRKSEGRRHGKGHVAKKGRRKGHENRYGRGKGRGHRKGHGRRETKLTEAGGVNVLYGSDGKGLRTDNDQWWHQNKKNVEAVAEKGDLFGWSLAAGDFNGDHVVDLAIGIPGESLKNERNVKRAGAVEILFGQASMGLSADNDQFWHQASGIQSVIEDNDYFGASLASADFDDDGIDDLAVGVPGEDVGKIHDAGLVNVLYGAYGEGLTATGQVWHQNKSGVKGSAGKKDWFGSALAAGNFDGAGALDLAIVSPLDNEGATDGSINVLYGDMPDGLSDVLDQLLDL